MAIPNTNININTNTDLKQTDNWILQDLSSEGGVPSSEVITTGTGFTIGVPSSEVITTGTGFTIGVPSSEVITTGTGFTIGDLSSVVIKDNIIDTTQSLFTLYNPDTGDLLVDIKKDGSIEFGDNYDPDETAREFWRNIIKTKSFFNINTLEEEKVIPSVGRRRRKIVVRKPQEV